MFKVVAAQLAVSVLVSLVAWVIGGQHAALSSLCGALACAVPNALFALNLALFGQSLGARRSGEPVNATAYALLLLAGEFFKVALTVGLLVLVAWAYKDVVWLALILSVIAVLLIQPAAMAWR